MNLFIRTHRDITRDWISIGYAKQRHKHLRCFTANPDLLLTLMGEVEVSCEKLHDSDWRFQIKEVFKKAIHLHNLAELGQVHGDTVLN